MTSPGRSPNQIIGVGLSVLLLGAACSPLPGGSMDPVYLKLPGKQADKGPAQPKPGPAASEPSSPLPQGTRTWLGRYRDSRGEGDITFALVRSQSVISGTWKTRMGGGGPVIATLEAGSPRWQLRMENSATGCPGSFEGWLELRGVALVGAYRGTDCEGAVSDGLFELREK